jgi:hypothetical protein
MYDAIFDVAVRYHDHDPSLFSDGEFRDDYYPSFTREIFPILRAPELAYWTLAEVNEISLGAHHGWTYDELAGRKSLTSRNSPAAIVAWLRQVSDANNAATSLQMPRLHGDSGDDGNSFLTLTRTQWHLMRQWAQDRFTKDWEGLPRRPDPNTRVTAQGLDRAALENCIGGAFYPGIEAGWILRDPRILRPCDPLRLRALPNGHEHDAYGLTPGGATMRSAVPWQADFYDCVNQWWPSHRPTDVRLASDPNAPSVKWDNNVADEQEMVEKWHELGFVLGAKRPGQPPFVEHERKLPRV